MLHRMIVGRVQLPDRPIYVREDSDTLMQAPQRASFLSIVDASLNPVPLCDVDQVLQKEVLAENRALTLSDLKERSPEHLSATRTWCESPDGYLEPAAVKRMLTTNCLRSPALSPLLIPAVLNSNTVTSWPSCCWRR